METEILDWVATTGGRWRYGSRRDGEEYGEGASNAWDVGRIGLLRAWAD
jgi:hypothetical protein